MSQSILMVLNPIFYNVSPKIVIFHELLIIETHDQVPLDLAWPQTLNTHHSSNLNAYFPSQNQQNVKFLPEIVILQELHITET